MHPLKKISFILFLGLFFNSFAYGNEVYTFVVKKDDEKKKSRWSLSEWIDTRDRMRMMDLWLSLHSPSPYEFYIGSEYQFSESSSLNRQQNYQLQAAAYASIFGLEFKFKPVNSQPVVDGLFNLRIFGMHHQSTQITLKGGLRAAVQSDSWRSALAGVGSTVYLAKFFGLDGLFEYQFDSTVSSEGLRNKAVSWQIGPFIDFNFIRVYGAYFNQTIDISNGAANTQSLVTGALLGARIYF